MKRTAEQQGTVFIVDDDQAIRQGMHFLMRSVGLPAEIFSSADDFLNQFDARRGGCLVLDIRMPGLGGLELRDRLLALGSSIPIIFMTGHGDVPMAVETMRKGAFDFIQKPFRDQDLLDKVTRALSMDEHSREERLRLAVVTARHETLTQREREVMELVVTGKPNKIIAHELGTSQRTVEIHRARVMDKMQARSLADLVRMCLQLQSGKTADSARDRTPV